MLKKIFFYHAIFNPIRKKSHRSDFLFNQHKKTFNIINKKIILISSSKRTISIT